MVLRSRPIIAIARRSVSLLLLTFLFGSMVLPVEAQIRVSGRINARKAPAKKAPLRTKTPIRTDQPAERITAVAAGERTTDEIMAEEAAKGEYKSNREILREMKLKRSKERPDRTNLPQGEHEAFRSDRYPIPSEGTIDAPQVAAQTIGPSFNAVTGPTETGAFPPDTEAEVGPNSILVFLNGRLRTFNKGTSSIAPTADGVINVSSDTFFASVMTPPPAGTITFTTDPNVRYDRISNRWFLNMIDVTVSTATGGIAIPNRVLLAVSDAASNGNITGATVWTFYQFQGDATLFTDYQSFGVDASALYIGGNMFTTAGSFANTKGFVIPKAPALTGGPLTVWAFPNLLVASAGPFAPRGADNLDPANVGPTAVGYFIGVDNATFSTLMMRRVTNPGSTTVAPTISGNISFATTLTTSFPLTVNHLGDTGGTAGNLDGLDDRLFHAFVRGGRLWTAHSIGVNNTGVTGSATRNAARWYEIQNLNTTPSVVQAGTLYDNSGVNDANQRNYWIPTITVSGQGHAVMGMSIAGTNERVNAFVTGRQASDPLGTMREGPGGAALPGYTASTTAYNPPGDPGGPRRWGDYSATVVDPLDDMTMWTFQEYCNATNTYGVRGVRLIAPPPPASLTASPSSTGTGQSSVNVVITGTQSNGSAFFDPGPNLPAPALPFNHITATITPPFAPDALGVNSITYNSPTQVTVNIDTTGATPGNKTITITNPDGQSTSVSFLVYAPSSASAPLSGRIVDENGRGVSKAALSVSNANGTITRSVVTNAFGYFVFADLPTGVNYVITPSHKRYDFAPASIVYEHSAEFGDLNFTAQPR